MSDCGPRAAGRCDSYQTLEMFKANFVSRVGDSEADLHRDIHIIIHLCYTFEAPAV